MRKYRKKGLQSMEHWMPDTNMVGVSVSEPDTANGSPMDGDMIAVNSDDPTDKWLVAKKFFEDNYEEA